jgi:hypothetical protein
MGTKPYEKMTVLIDKEQRQFLNNCMAHYYQQGAPMSMSSLIKKLIFNERNGLTEELKRKTT